MYTARNNRNQHNCLVLFQDLGSTPFIIFDTETTGIDLKKDYIVELAAIKYQIVDHSLFFSCPEYKSIYGDDHEGRSCNNRLTLVDYEVLEHTKDQYRVLMLNRKAISK